MKMARVILFTAQMDAMSRFYGEVLGLRQVTSEKGWQEFAAGGARIALHSGPASPGRKGPKIVFHAKGVAALREKLVARGARFGKVRQGEVFCLCDGKDPDGNPIQLSNR
jgi:catechol 2,3-dioxygenase-like lactoylglutathione lyase family enzyme